MVSRAADLVDRLRRRPAQPGSSWNSSGVASDRAGRAGGGAGLDGDAIEAEAWAYLAVRSFKGLPITFPTTTRVAGQ